MGLEGIERRKSLKHEQGTEDNEVLGSAWGAY